jgi:hypothetical protein
MNTNLFGDRTDAGKPPPPAPQHVITDKVSARTYSVVKGQIPDDILSGLLTNFTEEEIEKIHARVNKTLAPRSDRPQALWIFGPSACGKSMLGSQKANQLFGAQQNCVIIDGAEFREYHAGWQAVALHGQEHGVLHSDAWKTFKEAGRRVSKAENGGDGNGWSGQLKRKLLKEALRDRQHVLIPDCANHPDRLQKMIEEVRQAGYGMHALCLWAPVSVTRTRGEERAVREGKLWSSKEYRKCTVGELSLAMRWIDGMRDEPSTYCSLELWDNTHFPPTEVGLEAFAKLVEMSDEEASAHAARRALEHEKEHAAASVGNKAAAGKIRRKSFVAAGDAVLAVDGLLAGTLSNKSKPGHKDTSSAPKSFVVAPAPDEATSEQLHVEIPEPREVAGGRGAGSAALGAAPRKERLKGRLEGSVLGSLFGMLLGAGIAALICWVRASA